MVTPRWPHIFAPELPTRTEWINAPSPRMGAVVARNVSLVWFWDCCSLNSLRSLPYLREWHRRYSDRGLCMIGVHSPQFDFGKERAVVERAVRRLDIPFAVVVDSAYEIWKLYGNEVWPALYLWDRRGTLRHHHFGEGCYDQTERAVQMLLREIDDAVELPEPMQPLRATDDPDALVRVPTPHSYLEDDRSARLVHPGSTLSIRYRGAGAAAVLDGQGEVRVRVDGRPALSLRLDGPRLYELVDSLHHEDHELELHFDCEARAYAFSFAAGPAPSGVTPASRRSPGSPSAS